LLKAILDSLDDVPEAIRSEYKEQKIGDKTVFVLDLDGVNEHPAVVNLKSAHERVKADKKRLGDDLAAANAKLKDIPEDFDAAEWERLRADEATRSNDPDNKDVRKQVEAATASVKSQYETKLAKLKKDLEAEIASRDAKVSNLEGDLRKRLVTDGLTSALTEAGVTNPTFLKAARALLESGVEVVEDDGVRVAKMKSDLGGDDLAKYVQNWVQGDEGKAFVSPPKGADSKGSSGRASEDNPFGKTAWNKTAQGALIRSDRAKAERLAKAAGFASLEATYSASKPIAA